MARPLIADSATPVAFGPGDELLARRAAGDAAIFGDVPRDDAELVAHATARAIDPERRRAVVARLEQAWQAIDLPAASRAAAARLRDPAAHIVITGQQPALAGGPLHILVKALSAARLARRLETLGVAAVALFWIADEDHDVGELFSGAVPRGDGSATLAPVPFSRGRRPLRDRPLPEGGAEVSAAARRAFAGTPWQQAGEPWLRRLDASSAAGPGVSFRQLLLDILADEGLLPVWPALFAAETAALAGAELERPGTLREQVRGPVEWLRSQGLVAPIPEAAELPFFWIGADGGRHRLALEDGGQRVVERGNGGQSYRLDELRAGLAETPGRCSADALLRPLVQDVALEPLATVVGPTELAYHLELADAYRARGIRRPLLVPRLRVRLLDSELAERLRSAAIDPAELGPDADPVDLLPSPAGEATAAAIAAAGSELIRLADAAARQNPLLERRVGRLTRRWRADLQKLGAAVRRADDTGVEEPRAALRAALLEMWPDGKPGERHWAALYILARCGPHILEALGASFDPYDARTRLLIWHAEERP